MVKNGDDKEPPNLTMYKAGKQEELFINLRATLQHMVDMHDVIVEYQIVSARLKRSKYEALLKAGFTEEQALQMCQGIEIF